MTNASQTLSEQIDSDKSFIEKRKSLVISSALLLAITLSGAKIAEANTFILRIIFESPGRLNTALAVLCLFLVVRYYSYAQKYHKQLSRLTYKNFMNDHRVEHYCDNAGQLGGLIGSITERFADGGSMISNKYVISGVFKRELQIYKAYYDREDLGDQYFKTIQLNKSSRFWSKKDLPKLILLEIIIFIRTVFQNREFLDIYYPYIFALISVAYFFLIKEAVQP